MSTRSLRPSYDQLTSARSRVLVDLISMFPLSAVDRAAATPPSPAAEPRVVTDTRFEMDAEGRIIGKRQTSHVESPAPTSEPDAELQMPPMLQSLQFLTEPELRTVSSVGFARQVRPGTVAFDWGAVERAIGRDLTPIDHRILRASVPEPDPATVAADRRLAALRARLADTVV
jgi:hypothetical protein